MRERERKLESQRESKSKEEKKKNAKHRQNCTAETPFYVLLNILVHTEVTHLYIV